MTNPLKVIRSKQCLVAFFFTLFMAGTFVILSLLAAAWQYALLSLAVGAGLCVAFYIFFVCPKLEVHPDHLLIVGPLRNLTLPFDDIDIVLDAPMLTLRLKNGKTASCWGIMRRGRLLESEIQEARISARSQAISVQETTLHALGYAAMDGHRTESEHTLAATVDCEASEAKQMPACDSSHQGRTKQGKIPRNSTKDSGESGITRNITGEESSLPAVGGPSVKYKMRNIAVLAISGGGLLIAYASLYYFGR